MFLSQAIQHCFCGGMQVLKSHLSKSMDGRDDQACQPALPRITMHVANGETTGVQVMTQATDWSTKPWFGFNGFYRF